jgi:hypothetical protein
MASGPKLKDHQKIIKNGFSNQKYFSLKNISKVAKNNSRIQVNKE